MEKKFSIVINSQSNGYVAVLRCFVINDEGQQVTFDSKTLAELASVDDAIIAANDFVNKNTQD
jgi:hypothetical protein